MGSKKPEADFAKLGQDDRNYLKAILSKDLSQHERTCFALRLTGVLMFLFHLFVLLALDYFGDQYFMAAYGISEKSVIWWFAVGMSFLSCFIFYFSVRAYCQHVRIFHQLVNCDGKEKGDAADAAH